MAQRYGGKFSPDGKSPQAPRKSSRRIQVTPAGGRSNIMFIPAIPLVATTLWAGAIPMALGLGGAALWTLSAWLLREGLLAEAAFQDRKVAHRPAVPRKIFAALGFGIGTALAVSAHKESGGLLAALIFGVSTTALHLAAFGIDPLKSKGMEGIDSFQQDRVARVVDEAEKHLSAMTSAIARIGDRQAVAKLEDFQDAARTLIRTVEEDPRDLTAARKYLGVYLQGARDATIKFTEIYDRTQDKAAREDYFALLDDLEQNFAARTQKSLLDDRSDLTIEIDVLRDRLAREGVQLGK
ncbi:5-bromo-4-chloroindolyl phosphate hydrolysis family protein [Sulfitobacter sp. F26204]|uniref:5-bromo-4-chloroindolyl phosphate hydrolysis family protein n=1 Tax=Sulfitobacter sp. F26204 TaxID=2996014 RepID=UPI00225E5299|nr:5-bromo-4-chloroindolyl phosphate hydrolysis family protein [Sulfitobacter sp. F26204]MCX7559071.1 5-bromo-4-chloroindolyl phosphate hydrolysis family protein [Sulfitobacter sp. F26204]